MRDGCGARGAAPVFRFFGSRHCPHHGPFARHAAIIRAEIFRKATDFIDKARGKTFALVWTGGMEPDQLAELRVADATPAGEETSPWTQ